MWLAGSRPPLRRDSLGGVSNNGDPIRTSALRWLAIALGLAAYAGASRVPASGVLGLALWCMILAALVWVYRLTGGAWLDRSRSLRRAILHGVVLVLGALLALTVVAVLLSLGSSPKPSDYQSSFGTTPVPPLLLDVGLKPPIEEVLFRGLLFDLLLPKGAAFAVASTSVLFIIAHWIGQGDLGYVLSLAVPALLLGTLRAISKGIAVPAAFHVIMNAVLV